jgi:ketosteroid isomerase-like protein
MPDLTLIAVRFNENINRRDLDGLADLMSEDHRFVDSEGDVLEGKAACVAAWRGFFAAFPDYRNVFDQLSASTRVVTILGHSECSEPALAGPAIWTATIQHAKVAEWRVYVDTPEVRKALGVLTTRRPLRESRRGLRQSTITTRRARGRRSRAGRR